MSGDKPPDDRSMIDLLVDEYESSVQTITFMGRAICVRPMVFGELRKLSALYPDNTITQQAEAIIRRCKYPDNSPVFTKDDRDKLIGGVRMERFTALLAIIYGSGVETQAKNSAAGVPENTIASP